MLELMTPGDALLSHSRADALGYDRTTLSQGIVHIGVGNFHRAHQAWYLHRLMQQGAAGDWAIIGAGVRPQDARMRENLLAQDCLTTLISLEPDRISAEVTGAMIGYVPVEEDNGSLIQQMADPAIRIVSLTVTEGGYYLDPATGCLDTSHPDIQHDIAFPDAPITAFGAMVAALGKRRANGHGPFTGLSCDNLRSNGDTLRHALVRLARQNDQSLAHWIETEASFPNSVVDCIVPATGQREVDLARKFGGWDRVPVTHETYRQWVIEDNFCAGRPDLERVGVIFSEDVAAYESMKIRILNAGHQVLANSGVLLALDTIAACMAHPLISGFFRKVQHSEIAPTTAPTPDTTPADYVDLVAKRFSNPRIIDTTRRVAFDGSSRHAGFVLPIVRSRLMANASVEGLALVEALWARMCQGTRESGATIEPNDPNWTALQARAQVARDDPLCWLAQPSIYDAEIRRSSFARSFSDWLERVCTDGVESTLSHYIEQH